MIHLVCDSGTFVQTVDGFVKCTGTLSTVSGIDLSLTMGAAEDLLIASLGVLAVAAGFRLLLRLVYNRL